MTTKTTATAAGAPRAVTPSTAVDTADPSGVLAQAFADLEVLQTRSGGRHHDAHGETCGSTPPAIIYWQRTDEVQLSALNEPEEPTWTRAVHR